MMVGSLLNPTEALFQSLFEGLFNSYKMFANVRVFFDNTEFQSLFEGLFNSYFTQLVFAALLAAIVSVPLRGIV